MRPVVHLCVVAVLAASGCSIGFGHADPGPRVIYADGFDGPPRAVQSPWRAVTGGGGWGNDEVQVYTDSVENARIDGHGHLAVIARRNDRGFTSARLSTKGELSIRHGRISARIAVPAGAGLHPAFWMLGDDIDRVGWPASGEIDIIETLNEASEYHTGVHVPGGPPSGRQSVSATGIPPAPLAGTFRIYWVNKLPGLIQTGIDDRTLLTVTPADLEPGSRWVLDKPLHLLLNIAVGGTWPGPAGPTTPPESTMLVDWVRVVAP
ncbi:MULTISPECIES: glycoside hydrolase family 16 protein [Gordonia]|uniref:glycoside hydrolase family 16 protein n=1 Tax=Gordonia TaxID=2053 RepID=UPI000558322C|nr:MULTISPECIES: glycoside hydrolase family 16 protein [Gordonia]MDH3011668.1 glycoside hydrolase family 16 protein [Gordonia alkanivorans]MDH3016831.1 glycoside hydrolase family 16 protein [Gordonia alkanivorans]MDH3020975.1 glycoside hydrolase family 16 protein [Gordonia alkanivorans]MDH3026629.1 glycoside hydrolase family 16 protein [Gordonia alkanivorans]MDH3042076.1 glycoside hydrolase family 16 protein [Gordonia alkanivorans]